MQRLMPTKLFTEDSATTSRPTQRDQANVTSKLETTSTAIVGGALRRFSASAPHLRTTLVEAMARAEGGRVASFTARVVRVYQRREAVGGPLLDSSSSSSSDW